MMLANLASYIIPSSLRKSPTIEAQTTQIETDTGTTTNSLKDQQEMLNYSEMTADALRGILRERGVAFRSKETKPKLIELCENSHVPVQSNADSLEIPATVYSSDGLPSNKNEPSRGNSRATTKSKQKPSVLSTDVAPVGDTTRRSTRNSTRSTMATTDSAVEKNDEPFRRSIRSASTLQSDSVALSKQTRSTSKKSQDSTTPTGKKQYDSVTKRSASVKDSTKKGVVSSTPRQKEINKKRNATESQENTADKYTASKTRNRSKVVHDDFIYYTASPSTSTKAKSPPKSAKAKTTNIAKSTKSSGFVIYTSHIMNNSSRNSPESHEFDDSMDVAQASERDYAMHSDSVEPNNEVSTLSGKTSNQTVKEATISESNNIIASDNKYYESIESGAREEDDDEDDDDVEDGAVDDVEDGAVDDEEDSDDDDDEGGDVDDDDEEEEEVDEDGDNFESFEGDHDSEVDNWYGVNGMYYDPEGPTNGMIDLVSDSESAKESVQPLLSVSAAVATTSAPAPATAATATATLPIAQIINEEKSSSGKESLVLENPTISAVINAVTLIGSKLVTAAASGKDVASNSLSEQEFSILKEILDRLRPQNSSPISSKKRPLELTVSTETEPEESALVAAREDKDATVQKKKAKFEEEEFAIASRKSLDGGNWSSRDSFLPGDDSPAKDFSHNAPLRGSAGIFGRVQTPYNKGYKAEPGSASKPPLDSFMKSGISNQPKIPLTPYYPRETSSGVLGSGTLPSSHQSEFKFPASSISSGYTPQFRANAAQFNRPSLTSSLKKASDESSLSYIERRRLQRESLGSASSIVAKQILSALGTIASPLEEQRKELVPRVFPQELEKKELPVVPNFSFAAAKTVPSAAGMGLNSSIEAGKTEPPKKSPKTVDTASSISKSEAAEKRVTFADPVPATTESPNAIDEDEEEIILEKKASVSFSVSSVSSDANEFSFNEPMVVRGIEDIPSESISKMSKAIKYNFTPPSKSKLKAVKVSSSSASSEQKSASKAQIPSEVAPAPVPASSAKPAGSMGIWNTPAEGKKCPSCWSKNSKTAVKCASCEAVLDAGAAEPKKEAPKGVISDAPSAKPASSAGGSSIWDTVGKKTSLKCPVCLAQNPLDSSKCAACQASLVKGSESSGVNSSATAAISSNSSTITSSGFTFGAPAATSVASAGAETKSSVTTAAATSFSSNTFTAASSKTGFSFNAPAAPATSTTESNSDAAKSVPASASSAVTSTSGLFGAGSQGASAPFASSILSSASQAAAPSSSIPALPSTQGSFTGFSFSKPDAATSSAASVSAPATTAAASSVAPPASTTAAIFSFPPSKFDASAASKAGKPASTLSFGTLPPPPSDSTPVLASKGPFSLNATAKRVGDDDGDEDDFRRKRTMRSEDDKSESKAAVPTQEKQPAPSPFGAAAFGAFGGANALQKKEGDDTGKTTFGSSLSSASSFGAGASSQPSTAPAFGFGKASDSSVVKAVEPFGAAGASSSVAPVTTALPSSSVPSFGSTAFGAPALALAAPAFAGTSAGPFSGFSAAPAVPSEPSKDFAPKFGAQSSFGIPSATAPATASLSSSTPAFGAPLTAQTESKSASSAPLFGAAFGSAVGNKKEETTSFNNSFGGSSGFAFASQGFQAQAPASSANAAMAPGAQQVQQSSHGAMDSPQSVDMSGNSKSAPPISSVPIFSAGSAQFGSSSSSATAPPSIATTAFAPATGNPFGGNNAFGAVSSAPFGVAPAATAPSPFPGGSAATGAPAFSAPFASTSSFSSLTAPAMAIPAFNAGGGIAPFGSASNAPTPTIGFQAGPFSSTPGSGGMNQAFNPSSSNSQFGMIRSNSSNPSSAAATPGGMNQAFNATGNSQFGMIRNNSSNLSGGSSENLFSLGTAEKNNNNNTAGRRKLKVTRK